MQQYLVLGILGIGIFAVIIEVTNWLQRKIQSKVNTNNTSQLQKLLQLCKIIEGKIQGFNQRVLLMKQASLNQSPSRIIFPDNHILEQHQQLVTNFSQSFDHMKQQKSQLNDKFSLQIKQHGQGMRTKIEYQIQLDRLRAKLKQAQQRNHQLITQLDNKNNTLATNKRNSDYLEDQIRMLEVQIKAQKNTTLKIQQQAQASETLEFGGNKRKNYELKDIIEMPMSISNATNKQLQSKSFISVGVQTESQNPNEIYLQTPKKQYQQQETLLPISTGYPSNHFILPNSISPKSKSLKEIKSQLEFCQLQLNQAYNTQMDLKLQINSLNRQLFDYGKTKQRMHGYQKTIAEMKPVIQEYNNLQKKYQDIKRDYDQLSMRYKHMVKNGSSGAIILNARINKSGGGKLQGQSTLRDSGSKTSKKEKYKSSISPHSVKSEHLIYGIFTQCSFLNDENRHFLVKTLKRLMELPSKTQQLYKFDKVHPHNPHQFIDHTPHIMLLIQLKNGKIIGAYTEKPFKNYGTRNQRNQSFTRGYIDNRTFIVDITSEKVFLNTKQIKSIVYDSGSLIWGNEALVIKNSEPNIVYSNLCTEHSYYWDGFTTIEQFLGTKNMRTWETIANYQIYSIVFL